MNAVRPADDLVPRVGLIALRRQGTTVFGCPRIGYPRAHDGTRAFGASAPTWAEPLADQQISTVAFAEDFHGANPTTRNFTTEITESTENDKMRRERQLMGFADPSELEVVVSVSSVISVVKN